MALCLLSSHVQTAAPRGLDRSNSYRQGIPPPARSHQPDSSHRYRSPVPAPCLNLLMFLADISHPTGIAVLRVIRQSSPLKQEFEVKHIREQACFNVRAALVWQLAKYRTHIMLKVTPRPQFCHLRHHRKVRNSKAMETFSKIWEERKALVSLHS